MSVGEVIDNGYEPGHERGSDMWMEANQMSARMFENSKISALRGTFLNVFSQPVKLQKKSEFWYFL